MLISCDGVDWTVKNSKGYNILDLAILEGNTYAVEKIKSSYLVDSPKDHGDRAIDLSSVNIHTSEDLLAQEMDGLAVSRESPPEEENAATIDGRLKFNTIEEALVALKERIKEDIHALQKRHRLPEVLVLPLNYQNNETCPKAALAEFNVADLVEKLPEPGYYFVIQGWKLENVGTKDSVTEIDVCAIHPEKGMIFIEVGTTKKKGVAKVNKNQPLVALKHLTKIFQTYLEEKFPNDPINTKAVDEIFSSFLCYILLTNSSSGLTSNSGTLVLTKEDYNQNSFHGKVKFGDIPSDYKLFYSEEVYPFLVGKYIIDNAFMAMPSNSRAHIEKKMKEIREEAKSPSKENETLSKIKGLYLSANQCGILALDYHSLVIKGVSGTGKTLLLYQKMRQCLDRDEACLFLSDKVELLETTRQLFQGWGPDIGEKFQIKVTKSFSNEIEDTFPIGEHYKRNDGRLILVNGCGCNGNGISASQQKFLKKWREYNLFLDEYEGSGCQMEGIWFLFLSCPVKQDFSGPCPNRFRWLAHDEAQLETVAKRLEDFPAVSLVGIYRSPANFFPLVKWLYDQAIKYKETRSPTGSGTVPMMAHGIASYLRPKYVVIGRSKSVPCPSCKDALDRKLVEQEIVKLSKYKRSQFTVLGLTKNLNVPLAGSVKFSGNPMDYKGSQNDIIILVDGNVTRYHYDQYIALTRALAGFISILSKPVFDELYGDLPDEVKLTCDINYVDWAGNVCDEKTAESPVEHGCKCTAVRR